MHTYACLREALSSVLVLRSTHAVGLVGHTCDDASIGEVEARR